MATEPATYRAVETWDRDSGEGRGGSASQRPTHILIVMKQRLYQEMEKLLTIAANLCQTQPKQSHYLLKIKLRKLRTQNFLNRPQLIFNTEPRERTELLRKKLLDLTKI